MTEEKETVTGERIPARGIIAATARTFVPNRKPQIKFELAYRFGDEITWHEVSEKEWSQEAFPSILQSAEDERKTEAR
jgi:hypothetical protein